MRALAGVVLAGVVALASGCATTPGAPESDGTAVSGSFVATRDFPVRAATSLTAEVRREVRSGERFDASIQAENSAGWRYITFRDGLEGFIFGQPYLPRR